MKKNKSIMMILAIMMIVMFGGCTVNQQLTEQAMIIEEVKEVPETAEPVIQEEAIEAVEPEAEEQIAAEEHKESSVAYPPLWYHRTYTKTDLVKVDPATGEVWIEDPEDMTDDSDLHVSGTRYYFDSILGDDKNDGLSRETPKKSFPVFGLLVEPGDGIFLKRGCEWNEELYITGATGGAKGTADAPITLASYGTGKTPVIAMNTKRNEQCITIDYPSFFEIRNICARDAHHGIYLKYDQRGAAPILGNEHIVIENCRFYNMFSEFHPNFDNPGHNYQYAWGAGILVGGNIMDSENTVLSDVTIDNCFFDETVVGFSIGVWAGPNKSRFRDFKITNNTATRMTSGLMNTFGCTGGLYKHNFLIGENGKLVKWGTTGGLLQGVKDWVVTENVFANVRNRDGNDGVGFDFEGWAENCEFSYNEIYGCDSGGLLIMYTMGPDKDIRVFGNLFYGNLRNPGDHFEMECDLMMLSANHINKPTGYAKNNIFYLHDTKRSHSIWSKIYGFLEKGDEADKVYRMDEWPGREQVNWPDQPVF